MELKDFSGKSKSFLSEGEIVNIYLNHQNEEELLGRAKLRKKLKESLPFITNNSSDFKLTVHSQVVFYSELWEVKWITKTKLGLEKVKPPTTKQWIRAHLYKGIKTSHKKEEPIFDLPPEKYKLIDKFISWNGREIY